MGQPTQLEKPYAYVEDIQLSYLDYFFSFEFSVLDFHSPSNNQYAYKLQGFDENWIETGNNNIASFTNLDGGHYKLLVKATNSYGKWGSKFLAINLYVSSPPWQTWWAYSLYIVIILFIISATVNYRTRLQQKVIAQQIKFILMLEQQVDEKTASLHQQTEKLLEANKTLEMLSYKDGLTNLYNRRYFDQTLATEINRHFRQQEMLSLIFCDIDYFKSYNYFYFQSR
jgi:hypothetical protein